MRTVVFFCLMLIAYAISPHFLTDKTNIAFLSVVLIASVILDVIDFLNKRNKD